MKWEVGMTGSISECVGGGRFRVASVSAEWEGRIGVVVDGEYRWPTAEFMDAYYILDPGTLGSSVKTVAEIRKGQPVFTGVAQYFPDALKAVAEVSRIGNEQHNPGQPLHWARGKSTDQLDAALRHMIDHTKGAVDTDGGYHLAKAAWRVLAELQLVLEKVGNK